MLIPFFACISGVLQIVRSVSIRHCLPHFIPLGVPLPIAEFRRDDENDVVTDHCYKNTGYRYDRDVYFHSDRSIVVSMGQWSGDNREGAYI